MDIRSEEGFFIVKGSCMCITTAVKKRTRGTNKGVEVDK
jgi:hypothetical protein